MLKKFLDGLLFGAGFAIAFAVVWMAWTFGASYFLPRMLEWSSSTTREPEFKRPVDTQVARPVPATPAETKEYSFFKRSGERMKIPEGGGILAMSPMTTAKGAKRPNTYQLWLTDSKLWQIRTVDEKVEVEELPYPPNANVSNLDELMRKNLGFGARQSTMTVSSHELGSLKSGGPSSRDATLNGKLSLTVEGVVFVQPNPY
ncbi:MAG TPA: hypothetical protein VNH80_09860 [Burkholderiales bacterium]|jgi:hypothetical protein|nr:hypothetical protein [Burkholderiales bacterium]